MPMIFRRNGKNPVKHESWLMPLDLAPKPALPTLSRMRVSGRLGGLKGPGTKRAMTVARRLVPLKGEV